MSRYQVPALLSITKDDLIAISNEIELECQKLGFEQDDNWIEYLEDAFHAGCDVLGIDPAAMEEVCEQRRRLEIAMKALGQVQHLMGRISHVGLVAEWERRAAK